MSRVVTGLQGNPVTAHEISNKYRIEGIVHNIDYYLTEKELVEVFRNIDVSREMRIEYKMLSSAMYELRGGNTRYAIMEATTAVELCVTHKIYERCCELGIDGNGLCDTFYRSLGNRFELLRHLGIDLATKDPGKEIVSPRNNLFHNRTIKPSRKECKTVIEAVRAYLDEYLPEMYE